MNNQLDAQKKAFRIAAKATRLKAYNSTPNAGALIAQNIIQQIDIPPNSKVSGFWPLAEELDTVPILKALHAAGHQVLLPVMQGANQPLAFACWAPGDQLVAAGFNTLEPAPNQARMIPEVMICPLLAFDRKGYRMGYGGGFYDRSIAQIQANHPLLTVGVAFAAQEVESIITGPYDMPLHKIVTEQEVITI
ncbi:MAG: 5-formyltetrahydrofolate cyclo-ligase [Gammaproteobacteria bacterium]|jgi:5-formyltetrahydrofolate cyclo-ligase|nr:5-formyltetrahydrofolate cyclo-ligase [Gammaproteobacteria bacterium]